MELKTDALDTDPVWGSFLIYFDAHLKSQLTPTCRYFNKEIKKLGLLAEEGDEEEMEVALGARPKKKARRTF